MPDIATSFTLDRSAAGSTRPLVVAAALASATVVGVASPVLWVPIAMSLLAAAVGAVVDAERRIIPDVAVVATAVPVVAAAVVHGRSGSAALGALTLGGVLVAVHLASPAAMGFGDVKMGAALGSTVGLLEPRLALVVVAVASAGAVITALVRRRSTVAFGPALVVGAVVAVVAATPLVSFLTGGPSPWL